MQIRCKHFDMDETQRKEIQFLNTTTILKQIWSSKV